MNYYKNDGDWELERLMLNLYLQYTCDAGMIGRLGYRYIDFEEVAAGLNNYTANIFELSMGYRW
jgi:hypothetical protein